LQEISRKFSKIFSKGKTPLDKENLAKGRYEIAVNLVFRLRTLANCSLEGYTPA
jgi:hypothetical protein